MQKLTCQEEICSSWYIKFRMHTASQYYNYKENMQNIHGAQTL